MWNSLTTGLAAYPGSDGPGAPSDSQERRAGRGGEEVEDAEVDEGGGFCLESSPPPTSRAPTDQDDGASNPYADSCYGEEEEGSSSPRAEESQVRESQLGQLDWVDHEERFYHEGSDSGFDAKPTGNGIVKGVKAAHDEVPQEMGEDAMAADEAQDVLNSLDDWSSSRDPTWTVGAKGRACTAEEDLAPSSSNPSSEPEASRAQYVFIDWELWLPDDAVSDGSAQATRPDEAPSSGYERAVPFDGMVPMEIDFAGMTWAAFILNVCNAIDHEMLFLGKHVLKNQYGSNPVMWVAYIERLSRYSKKDQPLIDSEEAYDDFVTACVANAHRRVIVKLHQKNPVAKQKHNAKAQRVASRLAALHGQTAEGERARQDAKRLRLNKHAEISSQSEIAGRLMHKYKTNRSDFGVEGPVYVDPSNRNMAFALTFERANKWAEAIVAKVPRVTEEVPPNLPYFKLQPVPRHAGARRSIPTTIGPAGDTSSSQSTSASAIAQDNVLPATPGRTEPAGNPPALAPRLRPIAEPPTPVEDFLTHCHISPDDAATRAALHEAGLSHWSGLSGLTAAQLMVDFKLKPGPAYLIVRHCPSYEVALLL